MRLARWLFAFGVLALGTAGAADTNGTWQRIDVEDGIALYKLEKPDQDLPGFRGETIIDAPLQGVVAVLRDVAHHTKWMHRCAESRILEEISAERAIIYNRTDVPWPIADRDVVLDTSFKTESGGKLVLLTFENAHSERFPPPERVVRMPRLSGFYRLWQLAPGRTKVRYQVEANIGGRVPQWIAQRVARDMPYETLSRLRKRVMERESRPAPGGPGSGSAR